MTVRGPLAGVSVIELAGIGPVPMAASLLSEMGATVVRIDRPSGAGGSLPGGLDRIGVRDRVVVELDLKSGSGIEVAHAMLAGADVLIEGFRPGVAERLGIGPEDVASANPRIVYVRVTGWGQTGPYASMAGHDINYIGVSGVLSSIGSTDPVPPLNLVGDYGGGAMFAVVGALAALVERAHTGRGGVVDVAMVDGASRLLGPIRDLLNVGMWTETRGSNLLDGGAPFYRAYATADGRFVAVGALEPRFYEEFVCGLGLDPEVLPDRNDPGTWPDLHQRFAEVLGAGTAAHWAEVFDGTDACVTPVLSMSEVGGHRHNAARGALADTPSGPVAAPAPRFGPLTGTDRVDDRSREGDGSGDAPAVSDTLVALGVSRTVAEDLVRRRAAYRV